MQPAMNKPIAVSRGGLTGSAASKPAPPLGSRAASRLTSRLLTRLALGLLLLLPLLTGCAQHETSADADESSQAAGPDNAADALAAGDRALGAGEQDKAMFYYVLAARLDPTNADAYTRIGAIHDAGGDRERAALAYQQALKADPRHADALAGLGILLAKQRDYAAAERLLSQSVDEDPGLARAYNALGVLADLNRDYGNARSHYQAALDIAPRSPMLHNNLGYSRYLAGDNLGAIASFETALELNPDYSLAWRNLGLVYSRQSRYREALEAFGKVQDSAKAYNDVGYIAMISGRLEDAESFFDQALRVAPDHYSLASENAERVRVLRGEP